MMTRYSTPTLRRCDYPVIYTPTPLGHAISACRVFFFFFQAEDGIRDAQESRGLGDVYKRQELGGDTLVSQEFEDGLAGVDWTQQLAKRETVWRWVSLSGLGAVAGDDEAVIGINFSTGEFDDGVGISQENAVWVNGKLHLLGHVAIVPPEGDRSSQDWVVKAGDGENCGEVCDSANGTAGCECVDLRFKPHGARGDALDVWFMKSIFVQPYGTFHGGLRLGDGTRVFLDANRTFGVTEDHVALW
eukprot:TRINITY_DN6737_c0_g2_i1.p1 TRINITY_DN6737_c0_g2~~TRINITY_DN6737_c0_g2_i1.p1  ORF type:complete len:245 (-),score=44.89 TRINITY_DN6737_c0_g2_i1:298-1032(-)